MDRKAFLKTQKLEAEKLLELSGDHPLMGPSLRSRIAAINEEIQKVPPSVKPTTTVLYFRGGPVTGSYGIAVDFTAKALSPFAEMVKTLYSAKKNGKVPNRGIIPNENEASLMITGLPRGSFGFELTAPDPQDLYQEDYVSQAMQQATRLIRSAAENDDVFLNDLAESPKRIISNLRDFLSAIADDNASVRLVTGDQEVDLSHEKVVIARDRVQNTETEEEIIVKVGIFRGATLDSRRFDFGLSNGASISGKIASEVTDSTVANMNKVYTDQNCTAQLKLITVTSRNNTTRTRYELLNISPINPTPF